jgi:hypothetical protein
MYRVGERDGCRTALTVEGKEGAGQRGRNCNFCVNYVVYILVADGIHSKGD